MHFDAYDLNAAIYDEMFLPDGTPRAHCRALYDTLRQLSDEELNALLQIIRNALGLSIHRRLHRRNHQRETLQVIFNSRRRRLAPL